MRIDFTHGQIKPNRKTPGHDSKGDAMPTLGQIFTEAKVWDALPIADRKAIINNLMLRDKKTVPLKSWAGLSDAQRTAIYRVDWQRALNPMHCDQCEAARINGIFCHETGCPNQKKTWLPERGE
jgi:hypothetical protein